MYKILLLIIVERYVLACDDHIPKTRSHLMPLLDVEADIIKNLGRYIEGEEKRISILKTHLKRYESEHMKAMSDIPKFLSNPINVFTLIKRLTTDLSFIRRKINQTTEFTRNSMLKYPVRKDVNDALKTMTLLQSTYQLDTTELAAGVINNTYREDRKSYVAEVTPMTVSDCIYLGKYTSENEDNLLSIAWYIEALHKYNESDADVYNLTDHTVIKLLCTAYAKEGDASTGMDLYALMVSADTRSYPRVVRRYRELLKEMLMSKKKGEAKITKEIQSREVGPTKLRSTGLHLIETLCRGELKPLKKNERLTCYYQTGPHPFLRLARVKTELLHRNPDIILYRDIISDAEIQHIHELANPDLSKAAIIFNTTDWDSRYVKIPEGRSKVAARINRRIGDITNLNMEFAEHLQFLDYGVGEYTAVQQDFYSKNKKGRKRRRMATIMFYLTEVSLGGATVFSEIDLTVFPVKGAALYWMNAHTSGEVDKNTFHATCPVLHGFYSVLTKWIFDVGQELRRPCGLRPQKERLTTTIRRTGRNRNDANMCKN